MTTKITSTDGSVNLNLELTEGVLTGEFGYGEEHEQLHLDTAAEVVNAFLEEFNQLDGPRRCLAFHGFVESVMHATKRARETMELSQDAARLMITMNMAAKEVADGIVQALSDAGPADTRIAVVFVGEDPDEDFQPSAAAREAADC